jgi:hypothetical protein
MPYITRNNKGEIVELHNSPENGGGNWIEAQDPEVLDFIKRSEITEQARQVLTSTDNEMVRVVEDLIDMLMERQIFIFTELPEAVQAKLNARKQLRKDMNSLENLINDDDAIF